MLCIRLFALMRPSDRSQFKSARAQRIDFCTTAPIRSTAREAQCAGDKDGGHQQKIARARAHTQTLGFALSNLERARRARRARIQIEILIICAIIASNKGDNLVCGFCGCAQNIVCVCACVCFWPGPPTRRYYKYLLRCCRGAFGAGPVAVKRLLDATSPSPSAVRVATRTVCLI